MIIRVFRGTVKPGKEDEYERLLVDEALPHFEHQSGFLGLHYGRPTEQAPYEFLVVTAWRDIPSIKQFAGNGWTQAKVHPAEADILVRTSVHHYEDPGAEALPAGTGAASYRPGAATPPIEAGPIKLDLAARRVYVDERVFELPPKEFGVLRELVLTPEHPVSSAELAARVWPANAYVTAEDVRRTIYRLRTLIGDRDRTKPLIRNRRGYGYLFDPSPGG